MKSIATALSVVLLLTACSDDPVAVAPIPPADQPELESPEQYQQKIRTVPFPRANDEIFVNPTPLIVPENMAEDKSLVFELSDTPDFAADRTITGKPQQWNMFNAHRALKIGRWYWRFKTIDNAGNESEWSETYDFVVRPETPRFVTPEFSVFVDRAPRNFPRLHCYSAATVEDARKNISSNPEYKSLISRAAAPLKTDYSNLTSFYTKAQELAQQTTWLYQAFYLTQRMEYAEKLLQIFKAFVAAPPSDAVLYSDNFTTSNLLYTLAACYDLVYPYVDSTTRAAAAKWMADVIERNFDTFRGYEENHIFDNHFWQQNYRHFLQACLLLYDDAAQSRRVMPMLEYLYELWTSRAPAGGFNRDGLWHNGTGYFNANINTLCYVPLLFSYITGYDFLQHPWYLNAGRALSFTTPPAGSNIGFGDGSENRQSANQQIASFADFLAYQTGDAYASWYARQCTQTLINDYEMRIYRACRLPKEYDAHPADRDAMLQWNRDCGEVAMHSNLFDLASDLALGFRSSTFGSGSHTLADQNAFNITYAGHDVFRSSGYYQNFNDAHNLMSYRHSRAHNTILVNGIGQPYSTQAWGRILRAGGGVEFAYAMGDASHAYCGVTTDPMWLSAFEAAGIQQTPQFGFGTTPLTKYHRHIAMLGSDAIVIYDEIEASASAQIDWLLHSRNEFEISPDGTVIEVGGGKLPYKARVNLFASSEMAVSKTNLWTVPPAIRDERYPAQWHLTARTRAPKVRYLAIIQVADNDRGLLPMSNKDGVITLGDWTIAPVLDTESPAAFSIANAAKDVIIDFGDGPVTLNGHTYPRHYNRSTFILDNIEGPCRFVELVDRTPFR